MTLDNYLWHGTVLWYCVSQFAHLFVVKTALMLGKPMPKESHKLICVATSN